MRHIANTIPVVLFLMLCGPSIKALQANNNPTVTDTYTHGLAPGDSIEVTFYDFTEVQSAIPVSIAADGTIHLPYAGTVKIAGLSPDAAAEAIEHALETKKIVKSANASVKVVSSSNYVAYVDGEVLKPGAVPLLAPAPLAYVLSASGGYTGLEGKHILILHRENNLPESLDFDSENPSVNTLNAMVVPGDVIHVTTTGMFYAVGEVGRPGIYPVTAGISIGNGTAGVGRVRHITLLQALAFVGGITPIAARSKALLIRTKPDGTREIIHIDILKLEKGQIADPLIQESDILFVPSSYLRNLTNNVFSNLVNSLYVLPAVTSTIQHP